MKKLATVVLLITIVATVIPVTAAPEGMESFIVRMEGAPLIAYEGEVAGIPATRPAEGAKINPSSAAAVQYRQHLEASQSLALQGAGVKQEQVINKYFYALNGFSAIMTKAQAEEMAKQLEEIACTIEAKVSDGDQLYGSVTTRDIINALAKQEVKIEKRMILLKEPIKTIGTFKVPIRVYKEVEPEISVEVVPEQ